MTAIDRREFLAGSTLAFSSAVCGVFGQPVWGGERDEVFVAACRRSGGGFALVLVTAEGQLLRTIPLTGRGHDFACSMRDGLVVAFARRPGRFALAFRVHDARPPMMFAPPLNRHFYGHGAFSGDGRLLYASENDFDAARGVIGVYDVTHGFSRVGEFPSHGVGPHDLALMADGKTLVVANGGIETHPDSGREKLNIPTMAPSLCFIDAQTGDLKVRHELARDLNKLSIRHLAAGRDGRVWFGGQWQGGMDDAPGLIGCAGLDAPITLKAESWPLGATLKGYIGSVALSADAEWLAASAPRAGTIVYLNTQADGGYRLSQLKDGCGVAAVSDGRFIVSSGFGVLRRESATGTTLPASSFKKLAFDNHIRRAG